jgi:hypothetical protein
MVKLVIGFVVVPARAFKRHSSMLRIVFLPNPSTAAASRKKKKNEA